MQNSLFVLLSHQLITRQKYCPGKQRTFHTKKKNVVRIVCWRRHWINVADEFSYIYIKYLWKDFNKSFPLNKACVFKKKKKKLKIHDREGLYILFKAHYTTQHQPKLPGFVSVNLCVCILWYVFLGRWVCLHKCITWYPLLERFILNWMFPVDKWMLFPFKKLQHFNENNIWMFVGVLHLIVL